MASREEFLSMFNQAFKRMIRRGCIWPLVERFLLCLTKRFLLKETRLHMASREALFVMFNQAFKKTFSKNNFEKARSQGGRRRQDS